MFLAATTFVQLMLGVSALSFSRYANVTNNSLLQADDSCKGYRIEAQACDIAKHARGTLRAKKDVRPIFVKFHKVGGTTLMELINTFTGVTTNCGRSCGECLCRGGAAKACTGHISRVVLQRYVHAVRQEKNSFLEAAATPDTQLIPEPERRRLFTSLDASKLDNRPGSVPLKWLPHRDDENAALLFITLLRDPVERIRSAYYFQQSPLNCHEPCAAKHMSFLEWMDHMRHDHETCCEYVSGFGVGSLTTSKKVLASLFDVVGFTEEMDDVYVDVARRFGVPACHLPQTVSCRDDSSHKEDWTPEQLTLAREIAADDIKIYDFARELVKKRRQADNATAEAEKCPDSSNWGFGWLTR